MLTVTLSAAPAPHTVRKIIQLVVSRNALIALTDDSEIWVLHGYDAVPPGGEGPKIEWRQLMALPATTAATAEPLRTW